MKRCVGWAISTGLLLSAGAAGAQGIPPDQARAGVILVSDFDGPSGFPRRGYAAELLPPGEVYAVLRDAGFAPLGTPRLRGVFYSVAATDLDGADGRVLIDGRSGRIIRFIPADADDSFARYDPVRPVPSFREVRPPRPPLPVPRVASRNSTAPLPRPAPPPIAAQPLPAPAQQTAAVPKPAETPPAAPAVEAKPSATIQPTQQMPPVQGLE
ncbi:hypothetical protein [Rhodopseudomonas palustris]|uniref:Uncharacterized protein n=1 Tax=Rhodopseudomonas palustris (strain BisB18) TaxID=316056 RepID=Q21BA3_RHOPB